MSSESKEIECFLYLLLNLILLLSKILLPQCLHSLLTKDWILIFLISKVDLRIKRDFLDVYRGDISHLEKIYVVFKSVSIPKLDRLGHLLSTLVCDSTSVAIHLGESGSLSKLGVPWLRRV